ncbi:MAG: hypothetical protein ACRDVP_04580 [Acidimicrobiales bacterium]
MAFVRQRAPGHYEIRAYVGRDPQRGTARAVFDGAREAPPVVVTSPGVKEIVVRLHELVDQLARRAR